MILAGDIGGTKTVLALFEGEGPAMRRPLLQETFPSRQYSTFVDVLSDFFSHSPWVRIRAACFGVAGPVVDGRCHTTNLPWLLDDRDLQAHLGIEQVRLLNDVEAAAYGMLHLQQEEFCVLNPESDPGRKGHAVLIAAGTGLGEALLYWDGLRYHPMASEGGHADFAPQSDEEIALLKYLRTQIGHVSYERILSGPGLFAIYRFLRETGYADEPAWLREKVQTGDPSVAVTEVGLAGGHPLCMEALTLFSRICGAAAGNLALHVLAYGGVYVGGGIAPKILTKLKDGSFMEGFTSKGRYVGFLKSIRVSVALNPLAPLIGAANFANCWGINALPHPVR
jgi:glucokinase